MSLHVFVCVHVRTVCVNALGNMSSKGTPRVEGSRRLQRDHTTTAWRSGDTAVTNNADK